MTSHCSEVSLDMLPFPAIEIAGVGSLREEDAYFQISIHPNSLPYLRIASDV